MDRVEKLWVYAMHFNLGAKDSESVQELPYTLTHDFWGVLKNLPFTGPNHNLNELSQLADCHIRYRLVQAGFNDKNENF